MSIITGDCFVNQLYPTQVSTNKNSVLRSGMSLKAQYTEAVVLMRLDIPHENYQRVQQQNSNAKNGAK